MSDSSNQEMKIKEWEQMNPEDRFGILGDVRRWVQTGFKVKFHSLLKQESSYPRDVELSRLQGVLARALYLFVEGRNFGKEKDRLEVFDWSNKLYDDLFGGKDSVIDLKGKRETAKANLVGPISVLTLMDLIRSADPQSSKKLRLSEVITEGDVDVTNKVDLILRFGDKSQYGELIRLVQLKSSRENYSSVTSIIPGERRREKIPAKVSIEDIEKMEQLAARVEKGASMPVDVRMYVIEVPAFDALAVNNIFGLITDQRARRIETFSERARKEGFLPK